MPPLTTIPFLLLLLLLLTTVISSVSTQTTTTTTYLLQPDAVALLSFKSKADLDNKLFYTLTEPFDYCQWQGVKCIQGRVVRFVLKSYSLRGTFPPYSLSGLDQLRVLSLHNNSLSGPIPDLSRLVNLKSLILTRNFFSGSFPLSVLSLHRLVILDFSRNNLTGPIPVQMSLLDRLNALRLDWNSFNGSVPPLNQTFLTVFNVSGNNLTGAIPVTPTLSRFEASSFSSNPGLCGGIVNRACESRNPNFFGSGNSSSPAAPLAQSAQAEGGGVAVVAVTPPSKGKHSRTNLVVGFTIGAFFLIAGFFFAFLVMVWKRKNPQLETEKEVLTVAESTQNSVYLSTSVSENAAEKKTQVANLSKSEVPEVKRGARSGCLVFCSNERGMYTLEQLMRASAELLGRGTIGTTYKAVLDNQVIVTVKRLDASKTSITASDVFERHMDMVGELRHPNLVPLIAYFQAKGERLLIYDYQPNGSLFSLIHGSRSTRAKPLHWTSCLKIAEDVAQGLAYIHQSSKLVHGNLKSSNVLLGPDFEACITDYCLAVLADTSSSEDPDSAACKAPEARKSTRRATTKSDVYAFGVLLIELLTGKHPSQHPYLVPTDMLDWVRAMREDDCGEDNELGMLTEVASVCSLTSPEQRPAMWQVLKMIQEIKESVMVEDNAAL